MASALYNKGKAEFLKGNIDWENDTLKLLLVDNGYTFDADHDFVADLTPGSNELSGTGYSRQTLASLAVNTDDANDRAEADAANIEFTTIDAGTADAAVIYKEVTNDSDSILIAYIQPTGFPIATGGADLQIIWDTEGVFYW